MREDICESYNIETGVCERKGNNSKICDNCHSLGHDESPLDSWNYSKDYDPKEVK